MVLRSGIIIPFQFRDKKKLLMIGAKNENRDLCIFDLKNVVRAAFGVCNFEFRNKKIGFIIPDDLLMSYLAQRHDLTNFVIEIRQGPDDDYEIKEQLAYDATCSSLTIQQQQQQQQQHEHQIQLQQHQHLQHQQQQQLQQAQEHVTKQFVSQPLRSNESATNAAYTPLPRDEHVQSPTEHHNNNNNNNSQQTPEPMTQSIDPMDIIPKGESEETERAYTIRHQIALAQHQQQQHQHQHQAQHQQHLPVHLQQQLMHTPPPPAPPSSSHVPPQQQQQQPQVVSSPYFPSFTQTLLSGGISGAGVTSTPLPSMPTSTPATQSSYVSGMNRYRKRGERMSKDQKEIYVRFFEENPSMLANRRNEALLEPLWAALVKKLNSVPQGAAKNIEEWKQTFDAWRYRVFMYARNNSKLTPSEAQNPKNYKPLTPTDQRAYALWTSHKHAMPQDIEKMEMFGHLDETNATNAEYDY